MKQDETNLPYSAMPALEAGERVLEAIRHKVKLAPPSQRSIERQHGWNRGYLSQVLSGHISLTLHHVLAIVESLELDAPAFLAEALNTDSWSSVAEIRQRLARYDAAFAELEAKGLLGDSDSGTGE